MATFSVFHPWTVVRSQRKISDTVYVLLCVSSHDTSMVVYMLLKIRSLVMKEYNTSLTFQFPVNEGG